MTDYCVRCLYEDYDGAEEPCINCVRDEDEYPTEFFPKRPPKPITNADRIRSMTDEELAKWLDDNDSNFPIYDGGERWLSWLKSPVAVSDD